MQKNNNKDVMCEVFASYGTKKWNASRYSVSKNASDKKTKQIKTKYEVIEAEEENCPKKPEDFQNWKEVETFIKNGKEHTDE